jgi:hypothetical protein
MPEIPDIGINQIDININPIFDIRTPRVLVPQHPVTTILAKPIVSYPGCVEHAEAVEDNKKYIQCDGQVPSYNAMEYNPEEMTVIKKQEANPVNNDTESPPAPPPPNAPITPAATAKVSCPTEAQEAKEPVGTFIEGFRQKVTGYKLIGNECIQLTEKVPLPQQIVAGLPSPGTVMTTGGIAVVATSSALLAKPLADILLKVIKPTVKKVVKKIAAIRGKPVPVLSVTERRDLQRERTQAIRALKSALKPKG